MATKVKLQYVALKHMKVGDGIREPGDPVPEANDWKNVHAYVARGDLAVVQERHPGGRPKKEQTSGDQ